MEENDELRPRRRVALRLVTLLVLLIVYPLSVGPAAVIAIRCGDAGIKALGIIYWPIAVIEESTGNHLFEHYCDWWIEHTGGDRRLR